jgi:hypothetical protein
VSSSADSSLRARLEALAVGFVLPGGHPYTDDAVRLACDLLADDLETPATVEVAVLSYGTAWSDSEPLIRAMLAEHEMPVPAPEATESERFDFILRAFGSGRLSLNVFLMALYRGLPEWHEQSEAQHALVRLATELDLETTQGGKARVESAMRKAARVASGADHEGAIGP